MLYDICSSQPIYSDVLILVIKFGMYKDNTEVSSLSIMDAIPDDSGTLSAYVECHPGQTVYIRCTSGDGATLMSTTTFSGYMAMPL